MSDPAASATTTPPPRVRVGAPDGDPHETIAAPTVPRHRPPPRPEGATVPVSLDDDLERVQGTLERLPHISMALGPGDWDDEVRDVAPIAASSDADLVITDVLGSGGMGRVLLAHQQSLRRDVAVKVLHSGLEHGSLLAEARLTGQLEHPNVVPVHALGRDASGRPVLVLKRIEGVRWKELLADAGHAFWAKIPGAHAAERLLTHVQILMQVCNALHFAHSRGVVHRDVKPDNVMIGAFGEVYVTDWGVATRSARLGAPAAQTTGASAGRDIVGTPAYMAPEMLFGDPDAVDARTDVFLLGATLHEVLTGKPRHDGRNVKAALEAAYSVRPYAYPPEVPAELSAAANRATRADPDERFANPSEMRAALESWVEHRGATRLAETAARGLARLRDAHSADAVEMRRLVAESRFGFREALRAWPEQPAAREGLRETLQLALRYETARGDVAAARNVIAEIEAAGESVPDELRAAFQTLADDDARTRSRAEQLAKLAHDMDLSTNARERRLLLGSLAVACGSLAAYFFLPRFTAHPGPLGYERLLIMPTIWVVAVVGSMLAFPARLMANAANRRALGMGALGMAAVVLHRVEGIREGLPAEGVVAGDHVIMAAVTAGMAISINPRLWPAPAAYLLTYALTLAVPARTLGFFMLASTVLLVTLARAIVLVPRDGK